MAALENLRTKIRNIPEFSEKNYSIAGYVFAVLITLTGLFLIYEVVTTDALVFKANWNMFKSPLGSLCLIIGFLCAIVWWGKFTHWSATPVEEVRDGFTGRVISRKENMDITEQLFAKVLMPILGHFVIEPIIYGAIIYYPIQCIIAVVGAIFPYILSLIVLGIIVGAWLFSKKCQFRYHSVVLVIAGLLFTIAFAWGGYAIGKSEPGSTIQMLAGDGQTAVGAENGKDAYGETSNALASSTEQMGNSVEEAPVEDEGDQFEGVGEEGLLGSLPMGTTEYVGDMAGYPIELKITKNDSSGEVSGVYKNVKYGTIMELSGESLPAMGGDINFYGSEGGNQWVFSLTGDASNITGTANAGDGKEQKISLRKK